MPFVEPIGRLVGRSYANDIVLQGNSYREKRGLLGAVHTMPQLFAMQINASKGKTISALIPSEQRQAILLDSETFEDGEVQVPRALMR